jgi:gluconolactonase
MSDQAWIPIALFSFACFACGSIGPPGAISDDGSVFIDGDGDAHGAPNPGRDAGGGFGGGGGEGGGEGEGTTDGAPNVNPATDASQDAEGGGPDGPHKDPAPADTAAVDAGPTAGENPLPPNPRVEKVVGGYSFLEGPLWLGDQGVLLFCDLRGSRIQKLTLPSQVNMLRSGSGATLGIAREPAGTLVMAESTGRRVSRMSATGGPVTTVANRGPMGAFQRPNDIIVAKDGTIYFTDMDAGVVYRIPAGGAPLVAARMNRPNGIALSPDQGTLYVASTADSLVRKFAVVSGGGLGAGSTFARTGNIADGIAIDDAGNVYVASEAGVQVFRPDGASHGTIPVPEVASNCSFGGPDRKTLYITARSSVYRIVLRIAGLP